MLRNRISTSNFLFGKLKPIVVSGNNAITTQPIAIMYKSKQVRILNAHTVDKIFLLLIHII